MESNVSKRTIWFLTIFEIRITRLKQANVWRHFFFIPNLIFLLDTDKNKQIGSAVNRGAPGSKRDQAKKFLKKEHGDHNMLVAIRIRPLNSMENNRGEQEIIRAEDRLLVSIVSSL